MVAVSRVNPNFPIPGIDQSSRGFRDNFSTIKTELEAIQGKSITLTGDVSGSALIDSGVADVVISCVVVGANAAAGGSNLSIQYNNNGAVDGQASFVYDPATGSVGIGTYSPSYPLDVWGDVALRSNLRIMGTTAGYGDLEINSNVGVVEVNSVGSLPVQFQMDEVTNLVISSTGVSIGYGTAVATRALDVNSAAPDVARFHGSANYSDNAVRLTTDQSNSSMGLILEQRSADSAGGIRIDRNGNISIHSGASMDAQLSSSTARVTVLPNGWVGVATNNPRMPLHVAGGMRTTSYSDIDPVSNTINTTLSAVLLDTWTDTIYRTARYTVQVTNPANGNVDVTQAILVHANGVAHMTTYGNVNSGGSLGTISCQTNGSQVQLLYTAAVAGVVVKLDAHYITI